MLDLDERLSVITGAAREMIRPSVYGQAIIILVYVPLLTPTGVEGKTFTPMALTVMVALAFAFVLSITFVPAMLAIWLGKPVEEKEGRIIGFLKARYEPSLRRSMKRPIATIGVAIGAFALASVAYTTLGQEFLPQLDEGDVLVQAMRIPGTSVDQRAGHAVPGRTGDLPPARGAFRLLQDGHRRARLRPDATQRQRHLHHPQAARPVARPQARQGRVRRSTGTAAERDPPATPTRSRSRSRCGSTS